jgi:acyl-homoserine lactone acylase PvdQ
MGGESARGRHAIKVLQNKNDFTLDSLAAAAYDSYLTWFDRPLPALLKAWDEAPASSPVKEKLSQPIAALRSWDHRWGVDSIPTSLAIFWAEKIQHRVRADAKKAGIAVEDYVAGKASPELLLEALAAACDKLQSSFGTWKTAWGDINRFQRLNDDIVPTFNDADASIPVAFTSGIWGSLAAFGAHAYPGTKKWYGTSGNSFVAVVEFGDRVRAKAVTAGGESGHPQSRHFDDEGLRYSKGDLRPVYFYREELQGHTERQYHPGS